MNELKLSGFITNLAKYNNGELIGEWVNFPIEQEEINIILSRIGINEANKGYFFSDFEVNILELKSILDEYASIDYLNELAKKIIDINNFELVEALSEAYGSNFLNQLDNIDNFTLYGNVVDKTDVGHLVVDEFGIIDIDSLGSIAFYLDYEAIGRDFLYNNDASLTVNGLLLATI